MGKILQNEGLIKVLLYPIVYEHAFKYSGLTRDKLCSGWNGMTLRLKLNGFLLSYEQASAYP